MKIRIKNKGFYDVRGQKKFHLLEEGQELEVRSLIIESPQDKFTCWATVGPEWSHNGRPFDRLVEVHREDCEVINE